MLENGRVINKLKDQKVERKLKNHYIDAVRQEKG